MSDEVNPDIRRIYIRAEKEEGGGVVATVGQPPGQSLSATDGFTARRTKPTRIPSDEVRLDLGRVLFQGAVADELANVAESTGVHRIVLDIPADPAVASLPWEAALPPRDEGRLRDKPPLGLWPRVSVVRQSTESSQNIQNDSQPLFSPDRVPGAYVLDAREAVPDLGLDAAVSPLDLENAPFAFALAPWNRTAKLADGWFAQCDVLHFIGHATATHLVVDGGELGWALNIEPTLATHAPRLVVLEACSAAAKVDDYRVSLAWELSRRVPAVLAMLSRIPTDAANVFTQRFYSEVAGGSPIDFAVQRARIALAASHDDWMLPVLYLSTPGSAAIPRAAAADDTSAIRQEHEPLALMQVVNAGPVVAHEVVWRRTAFSTPRLTSRQRARVDDTPGVVLSAWGDVAIAWGQGALQSWHGGTATSSDADFPPVHTRPMLLAVRTVHGAMLQVVTRDDSGVLSWVRGRRGTWGAPERLLDGASVVGGVLLDDGFLAVTADGTVEGGPSVSIPEGANELEWVAGIDAVSIGDTDIVAVWGRGWEGDGTARVFARHLSDGPDWRDVVLDDGIPAPARLGLLRVPESTRRRPRQIPPDCGMVIEQAGTGNLVPYDLTAEVRA